MSDEVVDVVSLPGIDVEIWRIEDEFCAVKAGEERAYIYTTYKDGSEKVWLEDGYTVKNEDKPDYAYVVERAFSLWLLCKALDSIKQLRKLELA